MREDKVNMHIAEQRTESTRVRRNEDDSSNSAGLTNNHKKFNFITEIASKFIGFYLSLFSLISPINF